MEYNPGFPYYLAIILFGIAIKASISLYDYSGYEKPPLFGDFEAQRHWQEITVNIPIENWYKNSSVNDLQYWGLDYPPLTAYHSYVLGKIAENLNVSYVSLHSSRGISNPDHKYFMRLTVLICDIFIYFSGIAFFYIFTMKIQNAKLKMLSFLIFLIFPGQSLIDNGHFQYNNVSLGLTLWASNFIMLQYYIVGSVLFAFALNYKQMELYHAVPFFVYLLRKCFYNKRRSNFSMNLPLLVKIATAVLLTFIITWLPWLTSSSRFKSVLLRIFPFERGVFEDKVSNFWCILNVLVKLKRIFTNHIMAYICLVTTGLSLLPGAINLWKYPNNKQFMYYMLIASLSFFIFSFQVHEKSILIAALPALMMFNEKPQICSWFLQICTFSMFPLLHKDGQLISFIATNLIFEASCQIFNAENISKSDTFRFLKSASVVGQFLLIALFLFGYAPETLPDIYSLLIATFSFLHFFMFLIYFNIQMFAQNEKLKK